MVAALTMVGAVPVSAQVMPPRLQSAEEALAQDAATWAARAGIATDAALAELRAQAATVPVTDALAREFADRLAGIVIDRHPYRITVHLTGAEPEAGRSVAAGGMTVPIDFVPGAAETRERLLAVLAARQDALRAALRRPPGMGVDPRTGTLLVLLSPGDLGGEAPDAAALRLGTIAGVPVTVRLLGSDAERDLADAAVAGGARVVGTSAADGRRYACTTGFTVTDGARSGVVTAAHCPDALDYVAAGADAVPLAFVGQWGWGYQDVQVNAAATPLAARFLADTAKTLTRPVTDLRPRGATRVGDVVCHRGERTGYSCAEVALTDFAPAGDLCGGACLPSWVAVRGPTCRAGDSGGPVFLGTVAYGIVKGGSYAPGGTCGFYYYMSLDYLPPGWTVLREPSP